MKYKKYIRIVAVVMLFYGYFLSIQSMVVSASEKNYYYGNENNTKYQGESTVVITSKLDFKRFDFGTKEDKVTKIIFEEGIEELPNGIFFKFPNVKQIILPETLVSINDAFNVIKYRFNGIEDHMLLKLESIYIPVTNINYMTQDGILYDKTQKSLLVYPNEKKDKMYQMPDTVKDISEYAFIDNKYLEVWNIGNEFIVSLTQYSNYFRLFNLSSLKEINVSQFNRSAITIDGVLYTYDKEELLYYPAGKAVNEFIVPEGVKQMGNAAFVRAKINKLVLPSTIETIQTRSFGSDPFEGSKITNITIKNNVTYSSYDGVIYNKNQTELVYWPENKIESDLKFPSTLKTISLSEDKIPCALKARTITIPKATTWVSGRGMNQLKEIKIEKGNKALVLDQGILYTKTKKTLLLMPCQSNIPEIIIPKQITSTYFDYGLEVLAKSITLLDIEPIQMEAFSNLTEIKLYKDSKKHKVVNGILYDADMKTLIYYPRAKKDTYYKMPDTVRYINVNALSELKYLEKITLSKNLGIQESDLLYGLDFRGCEKLKEIIVPSQNKNYSSKDGVLYNKNKTILVVYPYAKKATKFSIPESVEKVYLNSGNPYLQTLSIPQKVSFIQTNIETISRALTAMKGFTSLENIWVSKQNKIYISINGVLYKKSENGIILETYPMGKKDEIFNMPDNVIEILNVGNFRNHKY